MHHIDIGVTSKNNFKKNSCNVCHNSIRASLKSLRSKVSSIDVVIFFLFIGFTLLQESSTNLTLPRITARSKAILPSTCLATSPASRLIHNWMILGLELRIAR